MRESNNYRRYSEEAVERLKLIKKFQSIGCSLAELKEVLRDHDANTHSNLQIIDWIRGKKKEIESKHYASSFINSMVKWNGKKES